MEITPTDPEVIRLAYSHQQGEGLMHTNLDHRYCICTMGTIFHIEERSVSDIALGRTAVVARPQHSGNSCMDCGGMMVRTGTCETCTECGSTGGCG